jgi:hypothetical protein
VLETLLAAIELVDNSMVPGQAQSKFNQNEFQCKQQLSSSIFMAISKVTSETVTDLQSYQLFSFPLTSHTCLEGGYII